MGEVIDFKSRNSSQPNRESRKLTTKVHDIQDALKEIYAHLDDAYENLNTMETECNRVEAFYDEAILELAKSIGPENVPAEFLDFSKNLVVEVLETGEFQIKWSAPNQEFDIIFIPEED